MQIKRKSSNRYSCNTKRCGQLVACIICLILAAGGFVLYGMQKQAQHKARQDKLQIEQEEATLAKQQAQMEEQQKQLQDEQEQQAKEEEELARQKAAQDALVQKRLAARQQEEYDGLMEQLVQAEQKMDSIAKLVESGGQVSLELTSTTLPKTLDGNDNEGQIEKIKVLVQEAEAKLAKLEQVMSP